MYKILREKYNLFDFIDFEKLSSFLWQKKIEETWHKLKRNNRSILFRWDLCIKSKKVRLKLKKKEKVKISKDSKNKDWKMKLSMYVSKKTEIAWKM